MQHVDETGWKIGGRSAWLWVFADAHATLYRIRRSRGHEVVVEVLGVDRLGSRRDLLTSMDKLRAQVDASGRMEGMDRFGQKAWDMLSSPAAQKAFDLDSEPAAVRERYGFMPAFDAGAADRCGAPARAFRRRSARFDP